MALFSSSLTNMERVKSPSEYSGESPVILMADDDPDDRLFVKEAVARLDICEVRFAEDGEELLDYLNREGKYTDPQHAPQPDFILLDLNMPKKGGCEALAEIKSAPNLREMPVIIFTTSDQEEDRNNCRKAGANDYIVKPSSLDQLIEIINRLIARWQKALPTVSKAVKG
jgi:CheY-like chemotaxis protein